MNRLELDFAPRNLRFWSARASLTVWAALVGAMLALGAGLWALSALRAERLGLQETLARVVQSSASPSLNRSSEAATSFQAIDLAQVKAMNQALLSLNRPWPQLWDALERVSSARGVQVAILEMRPDSGNAQQNSEGDPGLRLLAEAKDSGHMLGFLRELRNEPFFVSILLSSHQINAQDPNKPVR
jgi:hypothetical protein